MASKREQIIEAIREKLATIAGVAVYRSRVTAIARGEGVAVVIQPGAPPLGEEVLRRANDLAERALMISVEVVARGAIPDQAADPYCVSAHAAVMEDQTLGGLCLFVRENGTQWLIDEADVDAVVVSMRYQINYRTAAHTLD